LLTLVTSPSHLLRSLSYFSQNSKTNKQSVYYEREDEVGLKAEVVIKIQLEIQRGRSSQADPGKGRYDGGSGREAV